jgi:hypothetical protein
MIGKHFGQVVDAAPNFVAIVDYGLEMWRQEDQNAAEPDK